MKTKTPFHLRKGPVFFIIAFIYASAILVCLFMGGCTTFKKCQQKYANTLTVTDSIKVPVVVSVLVPRDSVVTTFRTDTTYLYKEIQQGRAKVIIERTNTITTVQARCDTVTITKLTTVKVPGERVVWGVAPKYKTLFKIVLGLLILCMAINILQFFKTRKKNELQTPEDQL